MVGGGTKQEVTGLAVLQPGLFAEPYIPLPCTFPHFCGWTFI